MRAYSKLSHVDKARLLHELFPHEIISFIVFAKYTGAAFIREKATHQKNWADTNHPFQFDFWFDITSNSKARIEKNENQMAARSRLFADQLFDGFNAFFSIDCLEKFCQSGKCTNHKMKEAIRFFFL